MDGEFEFFQPRTFPEQAGHILGQGFRRERNSLHVELAGLDLGQVEDVVDRSSRLAPERMVISA